MLPELIPGEYPPALPARWRYGLLLALALALLAAAGSLRRHGPFRDRLGEFSTSLGDRTPAQRHNIALAAQALDGATLEPGGLFSFNGRVGPRTVARGYRRAAALMEGELVSSIGGGICQVSSTVYDAALQAGLQVVRRVHHPWAVRSVPPGRDATVWYGKTDLILRNSLGSPVRLRVQVADERLQVQVWGTDRGLRARTEVQLLAVIPPPDRIRYDARLARGQRRLGAPGQPGYRVRMIRWLQQPDRAAARETVAEDHYLPQPRLLIVGRGRPAIGNEARGL